MKKLYVGNLPYRITEEDLTSMFSKSGTVISSSIIRDRQTNRSKGFGFVEMEDAEADQAIADFNNYDMEGRKLVVNEARPMKERERSPRGNSY